MTSNPIQIREVGVEKLRVNQFVRITFADGTQYVIEIKKVTDQELIGVERGKDKVRYQTIQNEEKKYKISEISKYEIIVGHQNTDIDIWNNYFFLFEFI